VRLPFAVFACAVCMEQPTSIKAQERAEPVELETNLRKQCQRAGRSRSRRWYSLGMMELGGHSLRARRLVPKRFTEAAVRQSEPSAPLRRVLFARALRSTGTFSLHDHPRWKSPMRQGQRRADRPVGTRQYQVRLAPGWESLRT
jgi:hypothetical protein